MQPDYPFLRTAGRILNAGQARTILFTGNIHDLFRVEKPDGQIDYVPLIEYLIAKWNLPQYMLLVYELNGPIRFVNESDRPILRDAWLRWRVGLTGDQLAIKRVTESVRTTQDQDAAARAYDANLQSAVGNATVALELLRQMCLCSRTRIDGKPALDKNLIILIEAGDLLVPEGEITRLSDADRRRVSICHDWFSDPGFTNGGDSVVVFAESRSQLNQRIAGLPHVLESSVPSPDEAARKEFISWFNQRQPEIAKARLWSTEDDLAKYTAGLSLHALNQLLKGAAYQREPLSLDHVVAKVEEFIQSQLGEDVVEFKKPSHTLDDVVGFSRLKHFLRTELIPRFQSTGPDALPGAAVAGPIGGGKTFIFEAVASELDMVVLVIKNIRSQWFGQTDVIFERLKRVLEALSKVLIFVDEADTQFGAIGPEAHDTERRLTGKIQQLMSDPRTRGRVIWLLMTARIHLLSPDIRRPGRVGDLIIPVLDPEGADREAFLRWVVKDVVAGELDTAQLERLSDATINYSAASFASLRSELRAQTKVAGGSLPFERVLERVNDMLPADIRETREYQELQALVNCTRRSLLPDPTIDESQRAAWAAELRKLESKGIR
ncbi:MAG: hypothetical protein AMXMBFR84_07290 [Candidatus Hydrogenedentota bacterium]